MYFKTPLQKLVEGYGKSLLKLERDQNNVDCLDAANNAMGTSSIIYMTSIIQDQITQSKQMIRYIDFIHVHPEGKLDENEKVLELSKKLEEELEFHNVYRVRALEVFYILSKTISYASDGAYNLSEAPVESYSKSLRDSSKQLNDEIRNNFYKDASHHVNIHNAVEKVIDSISPQAANLNIKHLTERIGELRNKSQEYEVALLLHV